MDYAHNFSLIQYPGISDYFKKLKDEENSFWALNDINKFKQLTLENFTQFKNIQKDLTKLQAVIRSMENCDNTGIIINAILIQCFEEKLKEYLNNKRGIGIPTKNVFELQEYVEKFREKYLQYTENTVDYLNEDHPNLYLKLSDRDVENYRNDLMWNADGGLAEAKAICLSLQIQLEVFNIWNGKFEKLYDIGVGQRINKYRILRLGNYFGVVELEVNDIQGMAIGDVKFKEIERGNCLFKSMAALMHGNHDIKPEISQLTCKEDIELTLRDIAAKEVLPEDIRRVILEMIICGNPEQAGTRTRKLILGRRLAEKQLIKFKENINELKANHYANDYKEQWEQFDDGAKTSLANCLNALKKLIQAYSIKDFSLAMFAPDDEKEVKEDVQMLLELESWKQPEKIKKILASLGKNRADHFDVEVDPKRFLSLLEKRTSNAQLTVYRCMCYLEADKLRIFYSKFKEWEEKVKKGSIKEEDIKSGLLKIDNCIKDYARAYNAGLNRGSLGSHFADYDQIKKYADKSGFSYDVLMAVTLKPGAHELLFSPDWLAVGNRNLTEEAIYTVLKERFPNITISEPSKNEGLLNYYIGIKAEGENKDKFSLGVKPSSQTLFMLMVEYITIVSVKNQNKEWVPANSYFV